MSRTAVQEGAGGKTQVILSKSYQTRFFKMFIHHNLHHRTIFQHQYYQYYINNVHVYHQ